MPVTPPPGATVTPSGLILPLNGSVGWGDAVNQNFSLLDPLLANGEVWAESIISNGEAYDKTGATDMKAWMNRVLPQVKADKKILRFGWGRCALSGTVELLDRTMIKCPPRPKWGYKGEPPFAFIPHSGGFTGTEMFAYREPSLRTVNTGDANANMCYLENFVAYGASTSGGNDLAGVSGLITEGEVFGLVTSRILIRNFGVAGFWNKSLAAGNACRGHEHLFPEFESNGIWGAHLDGTTDTWMIGYHCHFNGIDSVDSTAGAVYLRGAGDTTLYDGKHTFNERGIVTGDAVAVSNGRPNSMNIMVIGGTTDRSRFGGLEHRAHGTRLFMFRNFNFGRDGKVDSHSSGTDTVAADNGTSYGILVDGGATAAAPIQFDGCSTQFGTDDDYPTGVSRGPYTTPSRGMKLGNTGYVGWNGGTLAGQFGAYEIDTVAKAKKFFLDPNTTLVTGQVDTPTFFKRHAMLTKKVAFGPQTWTDMPSAETRLRNSAGCYVLEDLTGMRQVRLIVGVVTAAPAGATLKPQYTTDTTGATGWTDFPASTSGTVATVDVGSVGFKGTGGPWTDLPLAAQGYVALRVVGAGGDGLADPVFGAIDLHLRAFV